ncbi:30S ribosomal protein S18 [Nocardioidaceae bacterium]|nr:30S ribosomal protein S18 [Nocardioidaceae bacterium]
MSPRGRTGGPRVVRKPRQPLLAPGVTSVDYKDVSLLRQFISDRGKIRSRRVTGLSPQQQRAVTRAVKNAREMALLPYTSVPGGSGRSTPTGGDR